MVLSPSYLGSSAFDAIPYRRSLAIGSILEQQPHDREMASVCSNVQRRCSFDRSGVQRCTVVQEESERIDVQCRGVKPCACCAVTDAPDFSRTRTEDLDPEAAA
jgi:hypothetical protein